MSETEPVLLRDQAEGPGAPESASRPLDPARPGRTSTGLEPAGRPGPRQALAGAPTVHVAGFWWRAVAAAIDLAVVVPSALIVTLIVSKLAGVRLPPSNLRLFDVDMWIDLVLATDPALVMALALFGAIGLTYLLVFQITLGRTLGMRVMRLRIIDLYGDRPSPARCAVRCAGYLASTATLFLGFLWMAFDSEKRGLHDWIAGTYVIRA